MQADLLETARGVALRYLGYSARSRTEMEQRLTRGDFPPEVIAAVIAEMEAHGWLNDEKFAHDWIEDRADRKKYGTRRLANELRNKGVEKTTIEEALANVDSDAERARAVAAAGTKWRPEQLRGLDSAAQQAEKRRMANFLQRRGFSWEIIRQVFNEYFANSEELS